MTMKSLGKKTIPIGLALALLLGSAAIGQEEEAESAEGLDELNPESSEVLDPEAPDSAEPIDGDEALTDEEQNAGAEVSTATMERFNPSEDISADRSVAYPNDI